MTPAHNHRAALADPQDHGARFAAIARRARAEGPGVWLEALATLEGWGRAAPEAQDAAAAEVVRRLGSGWRLEGMRLWSCPIGPGECDECDECQGGEISDDDSPCEGCDGTGRRTYLRANYHRLALFTHLATGAEFSLVPGKAARPLFDAWQNNYGDPATPPLLVARWPVIRGQQSKLTGGLYNNRPWPGVIGSGGEHMPSTGLSHGGVIERLTLYGLRLPTAAEWLHAARGGAPTRFPWGDEVDPSFVWCASNSHSRCKCGGHCLAPRARPPAEHEATGKHNAFGLVDTFGNVMEWCQDEANDDDVGAARVAMGGSYACTARSIETSAHAGHAARSSPRIGFRPVASIPGLEGL